MKSESFIRILAGVMILVSVALTHFVDIRWLFFTAFIGLNLTQSAITGFCPPTFVLDKLGWIDADNRIRIGGAPRA
jgi:hypothetical protein